MWCRYYTVRNLVVLVEDPFCVFQMISQELNSVVSIRNQKSWNQRNEMTRIPRERKRLILRQSNETLDFSCMGQFLLYDQRFFLSIICFRDKYSSRIIISQDKLVSPYITAHQLSSWAIGRRLKLGTLRFWAVVIISAILSCRRSRVEYKANGNIESERFLL